MNHNFMIDQKVTYQRRTWRISGVAHHGKKMVGVWIERKNKQGEKVERYLKKNAFAKIEVPG